MTAYRWVFGLAALTNLALGVWLGFFPGAFFTFLQLEPPGSPAPWVCLGVVVGIFTLLYAYVAVWPERGTLLVALGLFAKVLGPIAWLVAVARGEMPPRTFPLILIGDLLWWFPFLWYLLRNLPSRRTLIAWTGVAIHVLACLALLAVSGGVEVEPDLAARQRWVLDHVPLWCTTWMLWALASMSLIAFCAAWTARLLEGRAFPGWAIGGFLICALGLLFDLVGETVNLVWSTQPGRTVADFGRGAQIYTLLSAGTANGLYCVGGLLLSRLSWHIGFLRGWLGGLGIVMWVAGLGLTVMVLLEAELGMIVAGAVVMVLYIPWAALVGWRLRTGSAT